MPSSLSALQARKDRALREKLGGDGGVLGGIVVARPADIEGPRPGLGNVAIRAAAGFDPGDGLQEAGRHAVLSLLLGDRVEAEVAVIGPRRCRGTRREDGACYKQREENPKPHASPMP